MVNRIGDSKDIEKSTTFGCVALLDREHLERKIGLSHLPEEGKKVNASRIERWLGGESRFSNNVDYRKSIDAAIVNHSNLEENEFVVYVSLYDRETGEVPRTFDRTLFQGKSGYEIFKGNVEKILSAYDKPVAYSPKGTQNRSTLNDLV